MNGVHAQPFHTKSEYVENVKNTVVKLWFCVISFLAGIIKAFLFVVPYISLCIRS